MNFIKNLVIKFLIILKFACFASSLPLFVVQEELIRREIGSFVSSLPEEDFRGEYPLLQRIDEGDGHSSYHHRNPSRKFVFWRKQNDSGKQIVVLKSEEDHLHSNQRGIHVVLFYDRVESDEDERVYRVFYVYLRENANFPFELDSWGVFGAGKQILGQSLGWTSGFSSIYPDCRAEVPQSALKSFHPSSLDYDDNEDMDSEDVSPRSDPFPSQFNGEFPPKSDLSSYNGFFTDLENNSEDISYIRQTVAVYVYTLTIATLASSRETRKLAGLKLSPPGNLKSDLFRSLSLFKEAINDTENETERNKRADAKAENLNLELNERSDVLAEADKPTRGLSLFKDAVNDTENMPEKRANVIGSARERNLNNERTDVLAEGDKKTVEKGGIFRGSFMGLLLGTNGLLGGGIKPCDQNFNGNPNKVLKKGDKSLGDMASFFLKGLAESILGGSSSGDYVASLLATILSGGSPMKLWSNLMGGDGTEIMINFAQDFIANGGVNNLVKKAVGALKDVDFGMMDLFVHPIVDALEIQISEDRSILHYVVGGVDIHAGIRKIPSIGTPLGIITALFQKVTPSTQFPAFSPRNSQNGYSMETNLFGNIGWRTVDINQEELHEIPPDFPDTLVKFTGIGNCVQKLVSWKDISEIKDAFGAVEIYTRILRNQCVDRHKLHLLTVFASGLIKLEDDKKIQMNFKHPIVSKFKLSKSELADLTTSLEISVLSQVLHQAQNLPQTEISLLPRTLISASLRALEVARREIPRHFLKLSRAILLTLKTGFTKALQDFYRFKTCGKCPLRIFQEGKNSLFYINSAIQFIIKELKQFEIGGESAENAFLDFVSKNRNKLEKDLELYL